LTNLAGIYIHIPFCSKACVYCDFHFSTSLKRKAEVIKAIASEIELQRHYLPGKEIQSIYFGGGTPSLLEENEIEYIIDNIRSHFHWDESTEITLEANPDDLGLKKIKMLKKVGINRLSIGIQSFDEKQLKFMNRSHTVDQSYSSIENARKIGIENFSIDLIYGLPGQTIKEWEEQLSKALELKPPHISAYALTVEPKTALSNWIKKGKVKAPADEMAAKHFEIAQKILGKAGYEHYEVSNFASPGKRAVHNSSYWEGKAYLGIGPSAHSYDGKSTRQWNVANNATYLKKIEQEEVPAEKEELTEKDRFNEKLMVSLRRAEGLSLTELNSGFDPVYLEYLKRESETLLEKGDLELKNGHLLIPPHRRFYSDGVAASLFYI